MQPLVPQLLHVSVGEAEQPLPAVPAGLGGAEDRQMSFGPRLHVRLFFFF